MKRLIDILISLAALICFSPVIAIFCFLIWRQDKHSPFYIAPRIGKNGKPFQMVKLRSMVINADKSGVDSTSANDKRITRVGHMVRSYKLDELMQLYNVLKGDMSLVGPRPNVARDVALYTEEECKLLNMKPGITDFASIVFADEGDILKDKADPDLAYNQLIRPWKSRLGLFYIGHHSVRTDFQLLYLTALCVFSREKALQSVASLLKKLGASQELCQVSLREHALEPYPPPGTDQIVESREVVG